MSSYDILQNNFPSGELSPLWKGRSNSEFYRTGLDTCKNFMPMRPSGLRRRPGTEFLKATYGAGVAKIIPVSRDGYSLVCEITQGYARLWEVSAPGTILASVSSSVLNISSYFTEMQFAVNKGVIWIVHPDIKPITITISGSYPSYSLAAANPSFSGDVSFSSAGDYPGCVAFKGGRLFFGGTKNTPNAIFASMAPDYSSVNPDRYTDFSFTSGGIVTSDCALEVEDNELVQARWFLNSQRFLVGSSRIIFSDDGSAVTPTTFDISPTLRDGSGKIVAKGLRNYVIYAGVSGKTMNIMVYDSDSEQYISTCITTNSSHLFSAGIKDFDIAFMPDPIIWVLLEDGVILSCTIDTSANGILTGWARHTFSSSREAQAIVTIHGEDERDIVYILVEIDGSYHIEVLDMDDIFDENESKVYLDMRIARTSLSETNTFTYTALMAGETVSVMSEGAILPDVVVALDGTVTLDREVTSCEIGIAYESLAGFLSQEQPTNGQSSFGNKRRLKRATLRVYQSFGGYIGIQHESKSNMKSLLSEKYGERLYGEVLSLIDNDFVVDLQSPNMTSALLYVLTDLPTPLNILALKEKIELLET